MIYEHCKGCGKEISQGLFCIRCKHGPERKFVSTIEQERERAENEQENEQEPE